MADSQPIEVSFSDDEPQNGPARRGVEQFDAEVMQGSVVFVHECGVCQKVRPDYFGGNGPCTFIDKQ